MSVTKFVRRAWAAFFITTLVVSSSVPIAAEPAAPNRLRFRGQTITGTSTPFSGTPISIPGTIQVENYDLGGEGIAAHDTTPGNAGGRLRNDTVDITNGTSGGYLLGWTEAAEWLRYTVNVTAAGEYDVRFRVASLGVGGTFFLEANGVNVTGTLTVPDTGGWQTWQTVTDRVTLSAGQQVMRLVMLTSPNNSTGNFDSIELTRFVAPPPPPPTSSNLRLITWNIRGGSLSIGSNEFNQVVSLALAQNPDVVVMQEVSLFNGDQAVALRNEFQRQSGRTWYPSWAPSCTSGGCLGNLILSRIPTEATSNLLFNPTAFGRARIVVNGVPLEFISVHLGVDIDRKNRELAAMMEWARTFSTPRFVMGDFNSWWDETWIRQMRTEYYDTWFRHTGNQDGGYTIGNVRFDYIFFSQTGSNRLTIRSIRVIDSNLSDHRPVVAEFTVQ